MSMCKIVEEKKKKKMVVWYIWREEAVRGIVCWWREKKEEKEEERKKRGLYIVLGWGNSGGERRKKQVFFAPTVKLSSFKLYDWHCFVVIARCWLRSWCWSESKVRGIWGETENFRKCLARLPTSCKAGTALPEKRNNKASRDKIYVLLAIVEAIWDFRRNDSVTMWSE